MQSNKLRAISDWLIDGARSAIGPGALMAQTCERLVEAGLPLWRVGIFVRTLHPDVFGRNFIWRQGQEVVIGTADFDIQQSPEFLRSPLAILYSTGQEVRYRLEDPESKSFPFFDDMRAERVTDYVALPLKFIDGDYHASSWTTKHPGGFTDEQLDGLRSIVPPLARLIEVIGLRRIATMLLDTYVGNRAGARILAGQIRRGHTETMRVAIWLSDLRGFTPLSDRLPPETMVKLLNTYFDCQVGPILRNGGEVLKFMGDGLLAIFPIAEDGADSAGVCARILDAVTESRSNVDAMRYSEGNHVIDSFRFGVALHVGHVLYGNIGGGNRLDFTCIGPAINLAARMEKIAARLNRTVVASAQFVGAFDDGWTDLGEFPIAGLANAERVYGLRDEVPLLS
jgi:adenylate cyclase